MTVETRPLCFTSDVIRIVDMPSASFSSWVSRGLLDLGPDALGTGKRGQSRAISQPVAHQIAVAATLSHFGASVPDAVESGWRFAFGKFPRELDVSDAGDVTDAPDRAPGALFETGATALLYAPRGGAVLLRLSGAPSLPRLALETLAREAGRADGAFALIDLRDIHARISALFMVRR